MGRLEPLAPRIDELASVQPAELAEWISVEADDEPEVPGHDWTVELDDEVSLLVHPDRDDVANLLGEQAGVQSVVQLDREVLVVSAPRMCADGVRAAVVLAVSAANERLQDGAPAGQARILPAEVHVPPVPAPTAESARSSTEDDAESRLVTGHARCEGRLVQLWVNMDGILLLPAGTLPHGPLDPSDNPHLQRARLSSGRAAALAERHGGRWIPYPYLGSLRLRKPGLFRRRWSATITERSGASVSMTWKGTRPHALVLWGYVVARCGLGSVNGLP
ncbi:hypothetical protein [Arthrobacter subterraneus]|uniref:hypothetical protein n=1 Tax=Arthrobacter subterraneus TaxID=335973 RepID=UPI000B846B31|nr:hypothetical protein [Arthrobacter subterraneus]